MPPAFSRVQYLSTFLYGSGSHSNRVTVTPDRDTSVTLIGPMRGPLASILAQATRSFNIPSQRHVVLVALVIHGPLLAAVCTPGAL
jgi:hypothetical protein